MRSCHFRIRPDGVHRRMEAEIGRYPPSPAARYRGEVLRNDIAVAAVRWGDRRRLAGVQEAGNVRMPGEHSLDGSWQSREALAHGAGAV